MHRCVFPIRNFKQYIDAWFVFLLICRQISMEREEAERLELQRMMRGEFLQRDRAAAAKGKKKDDNSADVVHSGVGFIRLPVG